MSPDQLGSHRLDVISPIDRLYFVGHWVRPGGGITPVMISAMKVVHLITQRTAVQLVALPQQWSPVHLSQQHMTPLPHTLIRVGWDGGCMQEGHRHGTRHGYC